MKLINLIEDNFENDNEYYLNEDIMEFNPIIAEFLFNDNIINEDIFSDIKDAKNMVNSGLKKVIGKSISSIEKLKAKTIGKSGFKDSDTVYKLTKEQKKVMYHIYKKYGSDMVKQIKKFRKDVMIPYQVIKRNVVKNHSLTNKEIFGMTKEEYYKYRESGKRKIEAKGTFLKDIKNFQESKNISKNALQKAKKILRDFEEGKIVDLSSTNIEKILDEVGLGRDKLYGWSEGELEKTATKIREIERLLNDPDRDEGNGLVRISYGKHDRRGVKENRSVLEARVKSLYEHGISYTNNKIDSEGRKNKGSFKDALSVYFLRREQIKKMNETMSYNSFKPYYEKVLRDAVASADKVYGEKISSYSDLKGKSELNKMENKIWGLKSTGIKYSGNINDWYLKIKPEDFMDNTKYYDKPDSVIKAEKEVDKLLKRFERELKKTMSEEDISLCKKYRLFNNFLTVKQLKNSKDLFKSDKDLKDIEKEMDNEDQYVDIDEKISNYYNKNYKDLKDLEKAQKELKNLVKNEKLSPESKRKYDEFESRIDNKRDSEMSKTDRNKIENLINIINNKEYNGITDANEDLNDLNKLEKDYEKKYGIEETKSLRLDIQHAREKINFFLQSRGE